MMQRRHSWTRLILIPSALIMLLAAPCMLSAKTSSLPPTLEVPQQGKLLDRTLRAISQNYYDPERIDPKKMLEGALQEMQRKLPEFLVPDTASSTLSMTMGLASKRLRARPLGDLADLSKILHGVLDFVLMHYQKRDNLKPEEIEYAAISGMLEALDPHSNFLPPKVYKEFQVGTVGKFGGLGIVISLKDGYLTVISPIEDTPADRAGIKAGDRIMQINDESTINMSLTDAVNKLRGDAGTTVNIIVESTGKPSRKIAIKRAIINIDSVKQSLLTEGDKRIGYIKIKSFQGNTAIDVAKALVAFHEGGKTLDGLILDMRNNPGGLLNIAIQIADLFLQKGVIVTTVGPHDQLFDKSNAHNNGEPPSYPLAILVNEGSASASEIVAGALSRNNRAVTIGHRTFGKGSVQTLFELGNDAALKLTIAQYLPAGTESIQLVGITPDIELVPITVDQDAMNIVEDKLQREEDLEMHLGKDEARRKRVTNANALTQSIGYLKPKEDEKTLEARSVKEYSKKPDLEGDFSVDFARVLLASTKEGSKQALLKASAGVIKQAQAEQQKRVQEALAELKIDWSRHPEGSAPKLKLTYELVKDGKKISRAQAGDKVSLKLSVMNIGEGPASQLIAVGRSEAPIFVEREFPFGALAPGATRHFSAPLEIPESSATQDLSLELTFQEEHGNIPDPIKVVVPIVERPQPTFAFRANLIGVTKGKPLPLGRSIPFNIDIINQGKGTSSEETTVSISNECGEKFFIERGRKKLGTIASKGQRRASFAFHLAKGWKMNGEDCEVELTIVDLEHLAILTKRMTLDPETSTLMPEPGKTYAPPSIQVTKTPTSTHEDALLLSGTITDTDPIRDIFVTVGKKKVGYQASAETSTTMPFSMAVPLEEGSNTIVIGARDSEDLTQHKILVIDRLRDGPSVATP